MGWTSPPTSIDENATRQYCVETISGALGTPMNVVVVATAGGQVPEPAPPQVIRADETSPFYSMWVRGG